MKIPQSISKRLLISMVFLAVFLLIALPIGMNLLSQHNNPGPISNPDMVLNSPFVSQNYTAISTGKVNAWSTSSGSFAYNAGIFVANNSTIERITYNSSVVPVYAMAWIQAGTTNKLASDGGRIQYESINISYASSYEYYLNGLNYNGSNYSHLNSYAYSTGGNQGTSRNGSVTTKNSIVPFFGSPTPEEDVLMNRTYSYTIPQSGYSFGLSVPGTWLLSNGARQNNTMAINIKEKLGLVTSIKHVYLTENLNLTYVELDINFLLKYTPNLNVWNGGATINGNYSVELLGTGATTHISSVIHSNKSIVAL